VAEATAKKNKIHKQTAKKRNIFENFKSYGLPVPELIRMDNHMFDRHITLQHTANTRAAIKGSSGPNSRYALAVSNCFIFLPFFSLHQRWYPMILLWFFYDFVTMCEAHLVNTYHHLIIRSSNLIILSLSIVPCPKATSTWSSRTLLTASAQGPRRPARSNRWLTPSRPTAGTTTFRAPRNTL